MSRIATVLLVLAAAGLAVFVGTTARWRFSPERLASVGSPLYRFDPSDIQAIKIKNSETSYTLSRSREGWQSSADKGDEASPALVRSLMQTALSSPVLDRIEASTVRDDKDLATFGITQNSNRIDFVGDKPGTLLIGKTSPDGTRTYVAFKNSNTVYLIPKSLPDFVSINPESFRERRILTTDPTTIDFITIRRGPAVIELRRTGGSWRILKPVVDQANQTAVQSYLDLIASTAVASFAGKTHASQHPDAALDSAGTIELHSLAEETPLQISLTRPDEKGARTVHLLPRNISAVLPPGTPDLLAIDLHTLRDPALTRINPDMVDVIKIKTPHSDLLIEREGNAWRQGPVSAEDLFHILSSTHITAYRPATPAALQELGLSDPELRIEFVAVLSENTPESLAGEHPVLSLSIGTPQPDGTVPVLISGSPEIRSVPATFLDPLGMF